MIIDSHSHAWAKWPYEPPVPDFESRGRAEQLLFEMDRRGVDKAVLVSARIEHNPDNNDYCAECVRAHPDRLVQFADVDCSWMDTHHTDGAADRLAEAAEKYELKGYTHYVGGQDGWFDTDEGGKFLDKNAELNLIASWAVGSDFHPTLRAIARRYPSVIFLCHHMSAPPAAEPPPYPKLSEILKSAEVPNIYMKLSGFHYVSQTPWEYPYTDAHRIARALYEHFGAERLCWASDYPPVSGFMTYQQALEVVRTHLTFIPDADKDLILGLNMQRLLEER
jgi:predicted TIM-barrel fold metal-dependent hydrolase